MSNYQTWHRRLIGAWFLLVLLTATGGAVASAQQADTHWAPVHPSLLSAVGRSSEPVSFLVILEDQPEPELYLAQRSLRSATPDTRAAAIYHYLTDFAQRSQAPLRAWLDAQGIAYRPFYIVNAIEVYGDASVITALRQRPEIARLAANPEVRLPDVEAQESDFVLPRVGVADELPYGIVDAHAPEVWQMGYRGTGIVVASQDTGVVWDHIALKDGYRGWDPTTGSVSHAYNWFDVFDNYRSGCDPDPQVPCDDNGHGTHTVGTILGSEGVAAPFFTVGMAPDAQWMGCRNMRAGVGTPASYMACFQFFLAPHPQDGDPETDGDPSQRPDLINNSWYCPPTEGCDYDSLRAVVSNVRAAGIMVVVSAGNNGPSCTTIRYPISAYADVFSVGAHNSAGVIAGFSSRGPVTVDGSGRLKPEITAPGVSVLSASRSGGYATLSGTSMAAPHVAGAVALLWSAVPSLKGQIDETEQILIKSATPVLTSECTGGNTPLVPNPVYGYGRLDVARAVEMALNPAAVKVIITDTSSIQSVTAQITITDEFTGFVYQSETAGTGTNLVTRLYPGSYAFNITWQDQVRQEVFTLSADQDQTVDYELGPNVSLSLVFEWSDVLSPFDAALFIPYLRAE